MGLRWGNAVHDILFIISQRVVCTVYLNDMPVHGRWPDSPFPVLMTQISDIQYWGRDQWFVQLLKAHLHGSCTSTTPRSHSACVWNQWLNFARALCLRARARNRTLRALLNCEWRNVNVTIYYIILNYVCPRPVFSGLLKFQGARRVNHFRAPARKWFTRVT